MKYSQIISLTKEAFIEELRRKGSRVSNSPSQWTTAWLKEHNRPYHNVIDNKRYVGTLTEEEVAKAYEEEVKDCIEAIKRAKS